MGRARRQGILLTVAALAGAAVSLPIGLYLGRTATPVEPARPVARAAALRAHYSPALLSDPYVLEQWRRAAEVLETDCRQSGAHCAETRAARRKLIDLEGR